MGKCIDIGKDRQILIQGHGKLSTHFSLKKKLIAEWVNR
jgi:hypothetical protein